MTTTAALLQTETNTREIERRVLRAARFRLGRRRRLHADFQHGQWWITELGTGAQWSVVDCEDEQHGTCYFDFEQITEGDED